MDFLFSAETPATVRFIFAFVIVLALIGATAFLVRRFGGERLGTSSARGRQPRLAVIDATAVDGRRRLILIRRDNVEHLLMIGGPSDVVVEANIVRAAAAPAREVPGARQQPAAPAEAPARAVAMNEGSMWPLQPEPAPAATAPARRQPTMDEPMPVQWNTEPEPPAPMIPPRRAEVRPEPRADMRMDPRSDMRAEPRIDMRTEPRPADVRPIADPLAGLAAELARVQSDPPLPQPRPMREREAPRDRDKARDRETSRDRETPRDREGPRGRALQPERPIERLRPVPPPPPAPPAMADEPMAPSPEQNLAEMAQRLEAALRRPPKPPAEPRAPEAAPRPPMAAASAEPMMEPDPIPMAADPIAANEDAPPEPSQLPAPIRASGAKSGGQKSVYDSLEQEMASLLGRPNGKA